MVLGGCGVLVSHSAADSWTQRGGGWCNFVGRLCYSSLIGVEKTSMMEAATAAPSFGGDSLRPHHPILLGYWIMS